MFAEKETHTKCHLKNQEFWENKSHAKYLIIHIPKEQCACGSSHVDIVTAQLITTITALTK